MKAFCAIAALGLGLIGAMTPASAQYRGDPGYYGSREPDYGYRERGPRYRDRDDDYEERGPRSRGRDYGYEERGPRNRGRDLAFDERSYLRCNPDVLAAVRRGQTSAMAHYQTFGIREGRRLRC
jgi:hypothetical protein